MSMGVLGTAGLGMVLPMRRIRIFVCQGFVPVASSLDGVSRFPR